MKETHKMEAQAADERSRRSFLRAASVTAVAATGFAGTSAGHEVPACKKSEGKAPYKNPHCKKGHKKHKKKKRHKKRRKKEKKKKKHKKGRKKRRKGRKKGKRNKKKYDP
ncbi:hypothetical protein DMJ13_24485 [halophilic archaeon]|nr:hypothetical protein DMJ13_24485 [halophilic archaeon]